MAALVERGLRTVALVGLVELGVAVLAAGRWGEVLRARLALPVDSSLAHSMGRRGAMRAARHCACLFYSMYGLAISKLRRSNNKNNHHTEIWYLHDALRCYLAVNDTQ